MPAAEKEMRLQSTLTLAGHKASSVENPTALGEALKTGKYDLVLADVSDAAVVKERIESVSPKTRLVPVVSADRKDRKATEKEYGATITMPGNSGRLLASIDDAAEARAKATSRAR
jgi:DNA-binding NtrC family response regulator